MCTEVYTTFQKRAHSAQSAHSAQTCTCQQNVHFCALLSILCECHEKRDGCIPRPPSRQLRFRRGQPISRRACRPLCRSDARCIDCSFFHFSLRDPVWQQRQSRTENSYLDQTWRKIILEACSGDSVRCRVRRDPDSIICAGVLQKRGVQRDYFLWQPFLY